MKKQKKNSRAGHTEKKINDIFRINSINPYSPLNPKMSCSKLTDHL